MSLGRSRQRGRARYPTSSGAAGGPDFTLSGSSVTTEWNPVEVGTLTPNDETPAGAYFVLVNEDAGFAVVNG